MFEYQCTAIEAFDDHLQYLESEIQDFPKLSEQEAAVVRNPFHVSLNVADITAEVQDKFIGLWNDSTARGLLQEKMLAKFSCTMRHLYPYLALL